MFNNKKDPLLDQITDIMGKSKIAEEVERNLCEDLGIVSKKALPFEYHTLYENTLKERLNEALHPNQQKLDVHEPEKNKLTAQDFAKLRAMSKKKKNPIEEGKWNYPKDMTKSKETSDMGTTNASQNRKDRKDLRKSIKAKAHQERMKGMKEDTIEEGNKENKAKKNAAIEKIGMDHMKKMGGLIQSPKVRGRSVLKMDEEERLDELSKKTLGSYIKKAKDDAASHSQKTGWQKSKADEVGKQPSGGKRGISSWTDSEMNKWIGSNVSANYNKAKSDKRRAGIDKAVDRLTKEEVERLDEISPEKLGRYIKKASANRETATNDYNDGARKYDFRDPSQKSALKKISKRTEGIRRAANRLARNPNPDLRYADIKYGTHSYGLEEQELSRTKAKKGTVVKMKRTSVPDSEGSSFEVRQGKRVLTKGDYDRDSSSFWASTKKGEKGQKSYDTSKDVVKAVAKHLKEQGLLDEKCWKGYEMLGLKNKNGKKVPNCVPKEEVEQLDEISKKKVKDYISKNFKDIHKYDDDTEENNRKFHNRSKGLERALDKRDGNSRVKVPSLDEVAPPGAKFERMIKHIKKGYAKDGLSKNEKSIAYATAWKAKNKEEMKEAVLAEAKTQSAISKIRDNSDDHLSHSRADKTLVIRRGFYYRHGGTSESFANRKSNELNKLGIKHQVVDHGEVDKPFRGGATSVGRNSHWWVKVKLHEPESKEEMKEAVLAELKKNLGENTFDNLVELSTMGGFEPPEVEQPKPVVKREPAPVRSNVNPGPEAEKLGSLSTTDSGPPDTRPIATASNNRPADQQDRMNAAKPTPASRNSNPGPGAADLGKNDAGNPPIPSTQNRPEPKMPEPPEPAKAPTSQDIARQSIRAPVTASKGEGQTGTALAQSGVSRQDRLNQDFVNRTLGAGAAKAGSAEANLALKKHFDGLRNAANPPATPAKPAPASSLPNLTRGLADRQQTTAPTAPVTQAPRQVSNAPMPPVRPSSLPPRPAAPRVNVRNMGGLTESMEHTIRNMLETKKD